MVDFNNETTIGTPAADVVKILILQYRADTFEAYSQYLKKESQGITGNLPLVKARLKLWYLEMQAGLMRRHGTKEEYLTFLKWLESDNEEDTLKAIEYLNIECDTIKLTRIDTKTHYDSTRVEKENRVKHL